MNDDNAKKELDIEKIMHTYSGACLLVGWFQGGIRQVIDMLNNGEVDKAKNALEGLYNDGNERIDYFFYKPYSNQPATEQKEQAPE